VEHAQALGSEVHIIERQTYKLGDTELGVEQRYPYRAISDGDWTRALDREL
jgi:hypothetical protein